jgi:hypothetical protein
VTGPASTRPPESPGERDRRAPAEVVHGLYPDDAVRPLPFPTRQEGSPPARMLDLIISSAMQLHAETRDIQASVTHAATLAWVEGHIEGEAPARAAGTAATLRRRSDSATAVRASGATRYRWRARRSGGEHPGTPVFPARLRYAWRGTRLPRRVADRLGVPRPTTLDVATFPEQYDQRLLRMLAEQVTDFVWDPRVANLTLLVYPIDGAHLDDAPMSDRARNLVKRAAS